MSNYQLKEPVKKPLGERLPSYLMIVLLILFMVWIMLIRPLTMPADRMPFIFAYNPKTHQVYPHQQKIQYALWTGGAMLIAGLAIIPVIRNGNKHDHALALLWANKDYLETDEFSEVCDLLNANIFRNNGAGAAEQRLQEIINDHKGKHISGHKYFKKEFIEDLQLAS